MRRGQQRLLLRLGLDRSVQILDTRVRVVGRHGLNELRRHSIRHRSPVAGAYRAPERG